VIPTGIYRYEIRSGHELIAVEEDRFAGGAISGTRRATGGSGEFHVDAELDDAGRIVGVKARYARGPFSRSAAYEAKEDFLRGHVNAVGGRTVETAKLGRLREIDAGLVLFRALILAHIRERGEKRWTGRVATIDPDTLVARSPKQTCRLKEKTQTTWLYEPRMGDSEEVELDEIGRIVKIRDNRGTTVSMVGFESI